MKILKVLIFKTF